MKVVIDGKDNYWTVTKTKPDGTVYMVETLTWDEMLGCIASATMPARDNEHPGYFLKLIGTSTPSPK